MIDHIQNKRRKKEESLSRYTSIEREREGSIDSRINLFRFRSDMGRCFVLNERKEVISLEWAFITLRYGR